MIKKIIIMKYIKTNEEITNFLNKNILSKFNELSTKIKNHYNTGDSSCEQLQPIKPESKNILDVKRFIINNDKYKIELNMLLQKSGEDVIQRILSESKLGISLKVTNKRLNKYFKREFSEEFEKNDSTEKHLQWVISTVDRILVILDDILKAEQSQQDFYKEYEQSIIDYLWDIRDLVSGDFKIRKLDWRKGFEVKIKTNFKPKKSELASVEVWEINDFVTDVMVELNNLSKTLDEIGLRLKFSYDYFLTEGIIFFYILPGN
jgi:hypothetical protein